LETFTKILQCFLTEIFRSGNIADSSSPTDGWLPMRGMCNCA